MKQCLKKRDKVIICHRCGRKTMKLYKKIWRKRRGRNYKKLLGFYKCANCGNNCRKVFERDFFKKY